MNPCARRSGLLFLMMLGMLVGEARAWPPTIGPELAYKSAESEAAFIRRRGRFQFWNRWTFGLHRLLAEKDWQVPSRSGEHKQAIALKDKILAQCPDCEVKTEPGKHGLEAFRITFPNTNQYWVRISVDPGTVELQTKPMTLEDYRPLSKYVQDHVYAPAASLGLLPSAGDGHLNIGVLSAFPRVENFAEFLLDQVNHPELACGVLGMDFNNAPPLTVQSAEQRKRFFELMDRVKAGKIADHQTLAKALNFGVYYRSYSFVGPGDGQHYQAVSVKRVKELETGATDFPMELKYPTAQPDFERVLLAYDLMVRRIEWLNRRPEFSNLQREVALHPQEMTPREKLSRFAIFLKEMGTDLETYRPLIADKGIAEAGLDAFVGDRTDWRLPQTRWEIERYLPDLETSQWVRDRMSQLLQDGQMPPDVREKLMAKIRARVDREAVPASNRHVLRHFLEATGAKHSCPLGRLLPAAL